MKIHPTADYLVVQTESAEEVRASGIVLPDTAQKDMPGQGKVLAVGPDTKNIKMGDVVLFTTYSPKEVKVDGEEYLLLKEEDVLATVK